MQQKLAQNLFRLIPLAGLAGITILTGCATGTSSDAPVSDPIVQTAREPSPSDPFAAIDEAFARLALDTRADGSSEDDALVRLIWPRLVARFELAECPSGSSSDRWARWYADNSDYMQRVFNRARPWMHMIVEELEQRGMPGDLALLPVVESAFDPFAYSHGRAAGPWQFLSGTARDFGVEINDWFDGRRDFIVATGAALDYLEYLGGLFDGDWELALASYNAGQGRVQRAIRRNAARGQGVRYEDLTLPRETRGYVPKLKGLACLFRQPVKFAFVLPHIEDRPALAKVEFDGPLDVVALSRAAALDLTEVLTLNAGLNRHLTPPSGPHHLAVPIERADQVRQAISELPELPPLEPRMVRVQRGDSLSVLARRHGTSVDALMQANGMNSSRLVAGQQLVLPGSFNGEPARLPGLEEGYRELAALQQQLLPTDRFIHRVRQGESLWVIARRYGVSVAAVQQMNGLGRNSLIRPGQRLVIDADRKPEPPAVSPDGRYVVRQGDSLWQISRRHRVGIDDLLLWNELEADSVLRPGQQLIVRPRSDA